MFRTYMHAVTVRNLTGQTMLFGRKASEQGRIAGANAAGDQIEYAATAPTLTFHGMNTALFAAGDNGKNPNLLYKTAEFKDMGKGRYSKYYF